MTVPKIRASTQLNNDAGGVAPSTADFLVGTAQAGLSAEIVVGTTPGGELGGTWASPTVDATHSGSTHSAATDTHIADAADAHDASAVGVVPVGTITATDVQAALAQIAASAGSAAAFVGVHAYRSTNLAIVTATNTIVDLDSERYDTDGFHSAVTDTSRLTVPSGKDGYYHIIATVQYSANATGQRDARLKKNGATYLAIDTGDTDDNLQYRVNVSIIAPLVATDYIELEVRHIAGVNVNLEAANNFGIELMMYRVGGPAASTFLGIAKWGTD